jgi:hypothetical protein
MTETRHHRRPSCCRHRHWLGASCSALPHPSWEAFMSAADWVIVIWFAAITIAILLTLAVGVCRG